MTIWWFVPLALLLVVGIVVGLIEIKSYGLACTLFSIFAILAIISGFIGLITLSK